MVRLASLERVQQRPHLERRRDVEVTTISSKDRILQRTRDQALEGFAQDSVLQRLVVPEMVGQVEEVPERYPATDS